MNVVVETLAAAARLVSPRAQDKRQCVAAPEAAAATRHAVPAPYEAGRFGDGDEPANDDSEDEQESDDDGDVDELDEDGSEDDEDDGDDDDDCDDESDIDDDQDDDGDEYMMMMDTEDELSWDPDELRELVQVLRTKIVSLRQSARAAHKRKDHHCAGRLRKLIGPQTLHESQAAACLHEKRAVKYFKDELKRYSHCRAAIVNRLGLALTNAEREELRSKGLVQQVPPPLPAQPPPLPPPC